MLFIDSIDCRARKGVTPNEAALDGLAAAADLQWSSQKDKDLLVIHIFDAQPHGDWPNFTEHHNESGEPNKGNCCCCGDTSKLEWDRDVF